MAVPVTSTWTAALHGGRWRRGSTVTIDSDCHNASRLGRQMRLGVGTARRGGVQASHVLNTRPLAEVLAFFAAKRARAAGA